MHRTSAHHLLQEDILSFNCEDLTFLIYARKLNRTIMLLLMWNLSSIYPIFKMYSSVFKKFKDIKLLSFIARYRPRWNVHVLATTPHATKRFTHYTERFTRNVSCMEVTHLFGEVAIFRVSNKHIFFYFYPQFNNALQSTDNELLFWGKIHNHWHLLSWSTCVQT